MKSTKIALAGLGTVGIKVLELLESRGALYERRCGSRLQVVGVSARDRGLSRGYDISPYDWYDDAVAMVGESGADIVIELIGGSSGIALDLVEACIERGVHVVTANKALLAERGNDLARSSELAGVNIAYEAAIGGGIPIVKSLRESATSSDIGMISGIVNGTCNFILSRMSDSGVDFADALSEAQRLGFAEQDASFDVGGYDAAHKLALLSSLSFGMCVDFVNISVSGIESIDSRDIDYAKELGYRIKLLAQAEKLSDGVVVQSVGMVMLSLHHPLAYVEDSFNAIEYRDSENESIVLRGRGAGGGPTASAVIADIIDTVCGRHLAVFGLPYEQLSSPLRSGEIVDGSGSLEAYYIRLHVNDVAGVLSHVSRVFFEHDISIESLIQHGRSANMPVSVVFITHPCGFVDLGQALAEIGKFDFMLSSPCVIKIVY